jgi:hypothetical protein
LNSTELDTARTNASQEYELPAKERKYALKVLKEIIKMTNIQLKSINGMIKECITTLRGFEDLLTDSILYVKDRDNFINSNIDNLFKVKFSGLRSHIKMIPSWVHKYIADSSSFHTTSISYISDSYDQKISNDKIYNTFLEINKNTSKDITSLMEFIPDYIQNINTKIKALIGIEARLHDFHTEIENVYKSIK